MFTHQQIEHYKAFGSSYSEAPRRRGRGDHDGGRRLADREIRRYRRRQARPLAGAVPDLVLETDPGDVMAFDAHLFHSSVGGDKRLASSIEHPAVGR